MIRCNNCGHDNQPIFRFCLKCGHELERPPGDTTAAPRSTPVEPPAERCAACGAVVVAGLVFCPSCGRPYFEAAAAAVERGEIGRLELLEPDGREGGCYPLWNGRTRVGREEGDHLFPDDTMMTPLHADFIFEEGELTFFDRETRHGSFVRIHDVVPLGDGAQVRIGQQLLELRRKSDDSEGWGEMLRLAAGRDVDLSNDPDRYPLQDDNIFVGREQGHLVFPDDGYVSGSHAVIFRQDDQVRIKDLDSSNGTYVRLEAPLKLTSGRLLLLGTSLFRVVLD